MTSKYCVTNIRNLPGWMGGAINVLAIWLLGCLFPEVSLSLIQNVTDLKTRRGVLRETDG